MKILHTISSVNPSGGGPIEALGQLGRVNQDHGHHVEIASLDSPDSPFLKGSPLSVHALGPSNSQYYFSRRYVPWLRENASQYDIVVVNGLWQYTSFGAWKALNRQSTPYVVFTHGMLDPWFKRRYPFKHLKKYAYWPWGDYRVLRDAASVLFTCEEERILARQSFWPYSAKEKVVNLGVPSPPTSLEGERQELLERFPILQDKRVLLFMGRIHPKKACDVVIKAFASAFGGDPNWQLVMAGPDQVGWKASLQSLAAQLRVTDRITWTGMITGKLKWGLISSAELLFLPSHQENFGLVVAEAMACGTPVLISNKVNIWREIQADVAGLVVHDNVESATSALRAWQDLCSVDRLKMRRSARKSFENRFEINRAGDALVTLLQSLVGAGSTIGSHHDLEGAIAPPSISSRS